MHIIGVLNTKGGTGKTTLTSCLAVRASEEAKVAVCDLDPQASYSDWHKRRGDPKKNPDLVDGADRASEVVERLRRKGPAYDYVFLDGPPGSLIVTEDAVQVSTLVLIPIRASGLDLGASRDCIQICQELGVPFLVVISDKSVHDGKLVEQARALLASWKVPVANQAITHRVPFVNAITTGKTGAEKDKRAAEDIDSLWNEVKAALRKAAKARAA
jgi:chromosome partitioning protein